MSGESDSEGSALDSGSDSEVESEVESVLLHNGHDHARTETPSTTQSSPPRDTQSAAALNKSFVAKATPDSKLGSDQSKPFAPALLSAGVDWADMVGEETINGTAALPVIDFAELEEHGAEKLSSSSLPAQRVESGSSTPSAPPPPKANGDMGRQNGTDKPRRGKPAAPPPSLQAAGQSAREAYQHRLETDPSYVPVVGDFWGHDDRLLKRELRSLSGWWRGRWQSRGRGGRGGFAVRGMRGRGRGGFIGGQERPESANGNDVAEAGSSGPVDKAPSMKPDVPAIEKTWTHDGFEEMRAKEEARRAAFEQQRASKSVNEQNGTSSRGGFTPRGRGTFSPRRGAYSPSPSRQRAVPPTPFNLRPVGRDGTWYAMKPERVFTKMADGFLYFDPALKSRPDRKGGFRISIPGKTMEVVSAPKPSVRIKASAAEAQVSSETVSSVEQDKRYVVRLPIAKMSDKKVADSMLQQTSVGPEPLTTVEELPLEMTTSLPTSAQQQSPSVASSFNVVTSPLQPSVPSLNVPQISDLSGDQAIIPIAQDDPTTPPSLTRDSSSSEKSLVDIPLITSQVAVLDINEGKPAVERAHLDQLPPLQTVFPPAQPSPTFGSPYGFTPSLPPGIALNQQGYAYEIASGRAVYLHPTPPPPMPLYNPRPMHHSHSHGVFVPGHMHHPSLSADFLQAPHTPPINGFVDPATGQPLFALPRQSSRIEIRAPTDALDGKGKSERKPSNLRSTTTIEPNVPVSLEPIPPPHPSVQYIPAPEYFPTMSGAPPHAYPSSEGTTSTSPGNEDRQIPPPSMDLSMLGYPGFQQQYYYPEQYYPAYMDPGQYDPYATDPAHGPPVYY